MKEYGAENIKILDGLDAVRKVPSMYIGNTGLEGLHHLVYELVDNSVDEALEGYCDRISITIHRDNSVTCEDNGRGIPVALHEGENMSALELVLTKLHAGGKFDKESYKYSAGLHGVGLSVVNALSEYLEVEIRRAGKVYFQRYERGNKITNLKVIGDTDKTGTKVKFKPDKSIFESVEFSNEVLAHRMREISFLNNGIYIVLIDERKGKRQEFKHEGGVKSFVKFLNTNKTVLFGEPIYISSSKQTIDSLEVAIQYNDGYNENINSFVNNVNTQEGGSHIAGFRSALTRSINNFIQTNSTQKNKENVSGDDIKEGLVAVLSIKVQNPQFEGQTKTKLGNSEIKGFVESILNEKLSEYFEINQNIAKTIINKAYETKKAREAAKKAKELVKSKNLIESGILPGKLADCQESNPDLCELFIVEGDSAGGSAKQGRDRKIQAILPLKGKILNVEKSSQEKVLSNNEIKSVYMAVGINSDNIERLRYKKIIIMTDADVDGSHIRTLLLTLFYRKTPEIIMNGHLYIAQPPLYKAKQGNKETYIKDEDEFESFVTKRGLERVECRVGGRQIDRGPLKEHTEKMRRIERFLKDISRSGVSRAIVLELFRLNIHKREDFEEIQKLYAFKENVGKVGYSVEMERDREYNLFKLILRHAEKKETTEIDYEVCTQEDYIERLKDYNDVKEFYEEEIVITDGNSKQETKTVEEFIKYINEHGKEGISIQRYKGLGEMNPEQLWETTMNPEKRSLLRVSIEDAIEADQMFTVLMGSNIETRRAFIEENAMNVRNLDI
ncbi:MAG TPA: DNA topoisomerase (ATP-hydrolyzing) subunit B [Syntrophorhabdaceae bacterium]|nr:DNA topoisomerase (ATP-hydrolyzing) subunit B [Syntrophorhabdaceae bacterium]HOG39024.1 DNA topoisomerase (ATP-hydrolyzing) subunit B [Syntrophorhabdaceae bacterium]HOS05218.1 DNA topoisomerase (ATP-hydrolyzing) subunit B [Syntrophorhabdaceae bacterium]HPL40567.1 DNA topoisomerase (ATP-hydrolyzing) subunit B [Syntrophorhabdaceae bacterium]